MKRQSMRCLMLVIPFLAIALPVLSQTPTLFNGKSAITVTANTSLSVQGDVENQGLIVNNGHLKVNGQWVNAGTYEAGEGEVTFRSSSLTVPQIIHHNGQTFNRVTIAGGTKKIITSDIVIGRHINFNNGVVETSGNAKILFDPDVRITGASDASHINGSVYHKGSGPKLFPIGNGLVYLPVAMPDVSDPTSLIGVRSFEPGNVSLTPHTSLGAIDSRRYWHVDIASGAVAPSAIVLPLRDALWITDPAKVVVAQSAAPSDHFTSIGGELDGNTNYGAVKSELKVSMPFVALAISATEAPLVVYNAVSPNGDGLNDYLRIDNIEMHPQNKLTLMNRWGDKVFEIANYDNSERVFKGTTNLGPEKELVNGTYFYSLETSTGIKLNGFLVLKK